MEKKIKLDIDLITEELYKLLIEEFKEQNGLADCTIDEIEINAIAFTN
jgi:FtsZ-binding cell division protein ZapB